MGIAVFYDRFEAATLWGKDGVEFFEHLFANDTDFVVMFISSDYVAKKWPRHEGRAALSRAIAKKSEYVLPVRFDDSAIPGLPDTVQYMRAADYDPAALAALISEKIGLEGRGPDSLTIKLSTDETRLTGQMITPKVGQKLKVRYIATNPYILHVEVTALCACAGETTGGKILDLRGQEVTLKTSDVLP